MHRVRVPVDTLHLDGHDGTRLRAYRVGHGPVHWLLPPGLGTPALCWKPLFELLADRVTFLTWEMRGTYGSARPRDRRRLGIADHALDGIALAAQLGWQDYVTGGWSLGVQIGLEIRQRTGGARALVLLNGAYEHVLQTALPVPGGGPLLGAVLPVLGRAGPVLTPALRTVLNARQTPGLLRALGLTADDGPLLRDVMVEYAHVDAGMLVELARQAHAHSARAVLPTVTEPTLVLAGGRDTLTPPHLARQLHEQVRGSEFYLVPQGTHYSLLEFPELVCARIERFLQERVFEASSASSHGCQRTRNPVPRAKR